MSPNAVLVLLDVLDRAPNLLQQFRVGKQEPEHVVLAVRREANNDHINPAAKKGGEPRVEVVEQEPLHGVHVAMNQRQQFVMIRL